jgi:hypothetical protein
MTSDRIVFRTVVCLFHEVRPETIRGHTHTHDAMTSVSLLSKEN